jgi:transcriptional regulator with XRE-family HTH domain
MVIYVWFSFFFCTMDKKKDDTIKEDLDKLANRIKSLRIKLGYSNYESFAYEKNIPRAQYGRYEKGEDLRYSSLLKVIRALGVTPQEFFSEGFD